MQRPPPRHFSFLSSSLDTPPQVFPQRHKPSPSPLVAQSHTQQTTSDPQPYMHIVHLALGGCLAAPPVRYGITADTGGHLAYLLGAALAQARRPGVARIDLVTRAFDEPRFGPAYTQAVERIDAKVHIRRITGGGAAYLEKEDLLAALPELTESFLTLLATGPLPDLVHAHFADAAQIALAARERFGVPVVYTPHSLALGKRECGLGGPGLERRIARERRAIAEADAIIVSSRDEAERQLCSYGAEAAGRTYRVSPGVYLTPGGGGTAGAEALLAPFLRHPDRPLVLAIARPVAKKNLVALVTAFAKTPGLRDIANLAIVAGLRDGPDDGAAEQQTVISELLHAVDAHDLYGRVALPKRHRPHEVPQLYRLAAATGGCFVNPALHEPFGLTLLEAAAHGLPVVATECGGPCDILGDLRHGTLVDPSDASAIGGAILRTITDFAYRNALDAALARGLGDYSWETYARHSLATYASLSHPAAGSVYGAAGLPLSQFAPGGLAVRATARRPAVRHVLVSDMDGTLTGSRGGVLALHDVLRSKPLPFVLSTGRSLPEARRIMHRWSLPAPDAFVTAVGTEIHVPDERGRLQLDGAYAAHVSRGWDRTAVAKTLHRGAFTFQRDVEQRRWKLSLLGDADDARRVRETLAAAGLATTVTYSHGRYIDVTPAGVDKAAALAFVARRWDLTAADCIACGDSGNDAAMLRAAGRAVVVANALPELDDLTGEHVIRTRAPHAEGIVEALAGLGYGPASAKTSSHPTTGHSGGKRVDGGQVVLAEAAAIPGARAYGANGGADTRGENADIDVLARESANTNVLAKAVAKVLAA